MPEAQVAVIGAGIVGLAHAYEAARRGLSVVVFDRDERPRGASIRNFGMIWPIGQPPGNRLQLALRSRALWLEALKQINLPIASAGSIHLAYREEEVAVIQEFIAAAESNGYCCRWLSRDQVRAVCPAVRQEGLAGGLWSDTELVIDPRQVVETLPGYLNEQLGVQFRFGCPVHSIELPVLRTVRETWQVERVVVCTGDDFRGLYPEVFASSGMVKCKLQMMRTRKQPKGWRLGAALAAGLTLRFYPAFRICSTLAALEARIAAEMPEYEQYGIHVMASQTPEGEITIGDSHEYGAVVEVFDKPRIDELILNYLWRFLNLPHPEIAERWHGVYAKHPDSPYFTASPAPGIRIVTGLGGAGMTLSFGVAEKTLSDWL